MSDNADRFMLDVVMESVPHRDIDAQETASSSASAEDCSDFFDFDAYYNPGVETDVTTPPSEGEPADGSLPLAQGTTLAKNPSHAEDTPMPDAPAQESQSLNLWPQLSGPQPPRDKVIFLESSPSPQPSGEMSPKRPPQVRSASGQRTRVIKDLDKTNKVRERGACYHCKINKKGCDDAEICKECSKRFEKKPSCSKRACIRKPLKEMIPPKLGRWNWANPSLLMPGRNQFEAGAESVFCSLSVNGPYLELRASRFALANERQDGVQSFQGVGIMPSDLPSDENIYLWMERQILAENKPRFEAYMDKLLVGLASQQRARPQPWARQIPEQLVLETLRMRCMCKVWSAKQLFLEQRKAQISPFDIRFASMKDSLRLLAGRRISELERKITEDLEKYLGRKEPTSTHPMILVVKWVLLWQMILIYRQSLSLVLEQQQTNAEPISYGVMPDPAWRHDFRNETIQLLEAVIVIYSEVFQKNTTIEKVMTAELPFYPDDVVDLHTTHRKAWQALPGFYAKISGQVFPTDDLIVECFAAKEAKLLARARP